YYSLYGFLESSNYRLVPFESVEHNRRVALELAKLRERSRPVLQWKLAEKLRPQVTRLADYLRAVGEFPSWGFQPPLEEIARKYKIQPKLLERWNKYRASCDREDPLHLWVTAATTNDRQQLAAAPRP